MADRRKLTDSEIIADQKLLMAADRASHRPAKGSGDFGTAAIQYPRNDEADCAVDVLMCGDRGLFLLH